MCVFFSGDFWQPVFFKSGNKKTGDLSKKRPFSIKINKYISTTNIPTFTGITTLFFYNPTFA